MSKNGKTRYALVGAGGRAPMFLDPIATRFADDAEVVGLCDLNPARLAYHNRRLVDELSYHAVPTYAAAEFDKMVAQTKPDHVIVTTVDAFHHQYVVRALELGCDAITEKPMTIDDAKCRAIYDAVQRTGRRVRVTFNYRWTPGATFVHQLLRDGIVGEVLHVEMAYLLNTSHGADYFRRWHREKDRSGGLMVHKATHHFDLINWWIDAVPRTVFGMGRLAFYGRDNARRRGIETDYDRYTGHDTDDDPFAMKLDGSPALRGLYLDAEAHDGYQRDRNVFGDDITIEDTMSVLVQYRTGVVLNYSLNAFLPREGVQVAFNGTKGRLEYFEHHATHVVKGRAPEPVGPKVDWQSQCTVHPLFGEAYRLQVPKAEGDHGGGDTLLQEQIFSPHPPSDSHGRSAEHGQGAASILIGVAANQSFQSGAPVQIADLCPQLGDAVRLSELD